VRLRLCVHQLQKHCVQHCCLRIIVCIMCSMWLLPPCAPVLQRGSLAYGFPSRLAWPHTLLPYSLVDPPAPLGTPHSHMSRLVRLFSREQPSARPVLRPNATALQRKHDMPLLLPCTTCPSCCLAGLSCSEQPQQDGLLPSHPYSVQQINAHLLPCGPAQL
jgi:hypothetical protein